MCKSYRSPIIACHGYWKTDISMESEAASLLLLLKILYSVNSVVHDPKSGEKLKILILRILWNCLKGLLLSELDSFNCYCCAEVY